MESGGSPIEPELSRRPWQRSAGEAYERYLLGEATFEVTFNAALQYAERPAGQDIPPWVPLGKWAVFYGGPGGTEPRQPEERPDRIVVDVLYDISNNYDLEAAVVMAMRAAQNLQHLKLTKLAQRMVLPQLMGREVGIVLPRAEHTHKLVGHWKAGRRVRAHALVGSGATIQAPAPPAYPQGHQGGIMASKSKSNQEPLHVNQYRTKGAA